MAKEVAPIIIKKKKGHGHGHHGGAWKVAYADFVTAMMAFFMVMWIVNLSDEVRAEVEGFFNDPVGYNNKTRNKITIDAPAIPRAMKTEVEPRRYKRIVKKVGPGASKPVMQAENKLMHKIKKQLERIAAAHLDPELKKLMDSIKITITNEGLLIEFIEKTSEMFFELGSAQVRPDAKKLFLKVAEVLSETSRKLIIDGHTDSKAYASRMYDNWDLSGDRALALKRILLEGKIHPKMILAVRANADKKLRYPEDPYHFSNRRVSILLPYSYVETGPIANPAQDPKTINDLLVYDPITIGPKPIRVDPKLSNEIL